MTADKSQQKASILYIAGFGRSGSTILSLFLGMHPSMFAVGEINWLFDLWQRQKKRCGCGERLRNCTFWGKVREHFVDALPQISLKDAARITLQCERLNPLGYQGNDEYAVIWQQIINSVSEISQSPIIIDSSKSAINSINRPVALSKACGFDVKLVYLLRDPRAVNWSTMRIRRDRIKHTGVIGDTWDTGKTLTHWLLTDRQVRSRLDQFPMSTIVRYEEFISHPTITLQQMERDLDLDLSYLIKLVEAKKPLRSEHMLGGDSTRLQDEVYLRPDSQEWRRNLPSLSRYMTEWTFRVFKHPYVSLD